MRLVWAVGIAVLSLASLLLTSCETCSPRQNPDELREKTAKATAEIKQDTKAIAQGVREGLSRNTVLDLNSASAKDLSDLPGIDRTEADRIVANRPYTTSAELVSKKIISKQDYDRIKDRVTVKK